MVEQRDARRYSDQEVALILKLATQVQEGLPQSAPSGLTLQELQRAAQEAGISAASVAQAAALLEPAPPRERHFFGAATKFEIERIIDGELAESEIGDLIAIVRRELELPGTITAVLGAVDWHADEPFGHYSLTVTPRDGKTTIRVLVVRGELAAMTGAWITGLAALSTLLVTTALAPLLPPVGAIAIGLGASGTAGYGSLRMLWQRVARSWQARLNKLGNELAQTAEAAVSARTGKLTGGDS